MDIKIKHNIDWYIGGIEIDEIITKFAERAGLEESYYNKYTPRYTHLKFEDVTMKQFRVLKSRLLKSKRLKKSKYAKDIKLEITANNIE